MLRLLEEMNVEDEDAWGDGKSGGGGGDGEGNDNDAISIHVLRNGKKPSREEGPYDALLSDDIDDTMESET